MSNAEEAERVASSWQVQMRNREIKKLQLHLTELAFTVGQLLGSLDTNNNAGYRTARERLEELLAKEEQ